MANDELVLYTIFRSSAAWRVRIALAIKGVKYVSKAVSWDNKELMAELLSLNPAGRIPILVHNGRVLTESLAIVEYIDEWSKTVIDWTPRGPKRGRGRPQARWKDLFIRAIGPTFLREARSHEWHAMHIRAYS
ncbi:hypothetical protein PMAYCL1PPCAC_15033 [Pristionchus mayeri]|uniref:GST N-terminal domain-containing protein n=1 Tax=Pristionchus mayeri TaxID=1317129 RepID=A0AAN5CI41_9BILA|nr:hypothetical protein PMAYCL1PPCAC_15033 [Pristionchus mayeri]